MGEMLLNGRLYGASGIRELTQAQYDALPASKLTDGILYCIKDTGIVEGDKYAPVIYSLEEREIGVWTDGKPLYQKSYFIPSLPSSAGAQSYSLNMSGIEVKRTFGDAYWSSGTTRPFGVIGITGTPSVYDASNQITVAIENNSSIRIAVGTDRSSLSGIVTIQYTKTTDIPGSGTWGTDGVPMVHYDGTEKVIGTWFGETLYEKTWEYQSTSALTQDTDLISFPNVCIKELKCIAFNTTTRSAYVIPYSLNGYETCLRYADDYIKIKVQNDSWDTNYKFLITIQYTKTS